MIRVLYTVLQREILSFLHEIGYTVPIAAVAAAKGPCAIYIFRKGKEWKSKSICARIARAMKEGFLIKIDASNIVNILHIQYTRSKVECTLRNAPLLFKRGKNSWRKVILGILWHFSSLLRWKRISAATTLALMHVIEGGIDERNALYFPKSNWIEKLWVSCNQ